MLLWEVEALVQITCFFAGIAIGVTGAVLTLLYWEIIWITWLAAGIGISAYSEEISDRLALRLYQRLQKKRKDR